MARVVPSKLQKCIKTLHKFFVDCTPDLIPIFQKMAYSFFLCAKIVRNDTVSHTKVLEIDAVPDGPSPVPKVHIVTPLEFRLLLHDKHKLKMELTYLE